MARLTKLSLSVASAVLATAQVHAQAAPAVPAPGAAAASIDQAVSSSAVQPGTTSATTSPASGQDERIEEIVVTAQRRSESSQSVPISITAISAATLQKSGIAQTSDLQVVTPGLVWTTAVGVPTPFIRGVGSRDSTAANEAGVATYIDGIYYAAMPAALLGLPNIQRIEVLKGPQGTLFGRNANGGLIQIITSDPPSQMAVKASAGYSNYDTVTATGYVGGPLADQLSADLSGYYTDQSHGWGKNLNNGTEANLTKDLAFRGKLLFQPGEDTRVVLAGDYDHRRSNVGMSSNIAPGATGSDGKCGIAPFPAGYPACAPRPSSTFKGTIYDSQSDLYGISGKNGANRGSTVQGGASLSAEQGFGFATLRSLSSYRKLTAYVYADQEGTALPISDLTWRQYDRTFTQELQLASGSETGFTWIVGGFYMHRNAGYDPFRAFGYSLGLASPLDPAGQYGPGAAFGGSSEVFSRVITDSYAGYGQATIEVLPETHLTAGARYTSDHDGISTRQVDARGVQRAAANAKKTFSKVTYRFALDHKFGSSGLVYASYNRGFKAGLFNTTNSSATFSEPETLDAIEVGAKTDLLDRRLRLNVAVFHYDYKGLQLPVVVAGSIRTINAAQAKTEGLDFDMQALPVNGLTLRAGGSFLFQAKYTDFLNGPLYVPNGVGFSQVAADLSGNRQIRAPKFTGNASVDYSVETSVGGVGLNLSYFYNSGFFWTPDNRFPQNRFSLVNTQVSWTAPSKRYVVRLWSRNALNKKSYASYGISTAGVVGTPSEPRTYGITGEVAF